MINLRLQFKTPSFGPFKIFFVFHKSFPLAKKENSSMPCLYFTCLSKHTMTHCMTCHLSGS